MDENIDHLWENVLDIVKTKMSKPSFETWFKSTTATLMDNETLIVTAPNEFARDWIESRYAALLSDTIYDVSGTHMQIKFVIPQNQSEMQTDADTQEQKRNKRKKNERKPDRSKIMLNTKYIFDSFVIGNGNRFAHAASLAVAEAPAKAYNPLFIYGGVGLGKTHLMHAIGHYVLEHDPEANVVYLSSEKFTNEFINAIRDNETVEFRNKYRSVDVLLIDDIQFLAGKEQTQEEFFHTFNTLHEESKQIIISSDRPPKEIPTLEDRLRSRFEWGLITDIQPPDLETRIAILRKKAKAEKLNIPNDVIIHIANQIDTNIRELEGALIRVVAYSSLINRDIDKTLTEEALKDILPASKPKEITIMHIQKTVGEHFQVKLEELKSKKRTKSIAFPRQIAMYLSRELTEFSLPRIGEEFGGKDHTTVIHAHEKINRQIHQEPEFEKRVQSLIDQIKS